jgi:hypothetical protein
MLALSSTSGSEGKATGHRGQVRQGRVERTAADQAPAAMAVAVAVAEPKSGFPAPVPIWRSLVAAQAVPISAATAVFQAPRKVEALSLRREFTAATRDRRTVLRRSGALVAAVAALKAARRMAPTRAAGPRVWTRRAIRWPAIQELRRL